MTDTSSYKKCLNLDNFEIHSIFSFLAPTVCQSCRGGSRFDPLQSSPFTNTTDWQVAKIQEIQSQVDLILCMSFAQNYLSHS